MKKLLAILSKAGFDGFLLMIGMMILLAYFLPQPDRATMYGGGKQGHIDYSLWSE